jgi:type IV secretory pathway VirB10-like protein
MSIFGTIKDAIFGSAAAAAAPPPPPAEAAAPPPPPPPPPATLTEDQIYAVLQQHADALGQDLNYRESIVDLMKAMGQDSSLDARKQLATELGYTGDQNDTATMNIWLHQKTMEKMMNG